MDAQKALLAHGILRLPSQNVMGNTCDTANASSSVHEPCSISKQMPVDSLQPRPCSEFLPSKSPQRHLSEACMSPERLPIERTDLPDAERAEPGDSMSTLQKRLNRLTIQPIDCMSDFHIRSRKERRLDQVAANSPTTVPRNSLSVEFIPVKLQISHEPESEIHESFQAATTDSSYASSHSLSPTWSSVAFTDTFSPRHGAEAASPTISDFGEYFTEFKTATPFSTDQFTSLRPTTDRYGSDTFSQVEASESNVYQLPDADGSVLTLRDLSTIKDQPGLSNPFDAKDGNDLVEAWNDGAREGVKTTFEEFFDDHSYLSTVIL